MSYMDFLINMIAGAESGGQIYGARRYDAFAQAKIAKEVTITVGYPQFYGNSARDYYCDLYAVIPRAFPSWLITKLSQDWEALRWHPTDAQADILVAIETTKDGMQAQDEYFVELLEKYVENAREYGITDDSITAMWCEIEHLGGLSAALRIFNKIKEPYTVDKIMATLKLDQDDPTSESQVGDAIFWDRHTYCVACIKKYLKEDNAMDDYISNCGHDENGRYSGGQAGDQTGQEYVLKHWYSRPWSCVLRYPAAAVRARIAHNARAAAKNDLIGYDQDQRETYWEHLEASAYEPAEVSVPCEGDCSATTNANVKAAGYTLGIDALKNIDIGLTTSGMRKAYADAGFTVLTDSAYTDTYTNLLPGDVLLYDGHHVAIFVGTQDDPADPVPETWTATGVASSNADDVNVRRTPNGIILRKVDNGNLFEIDGTSVDGWIHVNVAGTIGYIYQSCVDYGGADPDPDPPPADADTRPIGELTEHVQAFTDTTFSTVAREFNAGDRVRIERKFMVTEVDDGDSKSFVVGDVIKTV